MGNMIEDLEGYFRSLVPGRDPLLLELEREAREENIPIVGPLVGTLLELLASACGARHILELGTANGYSAIYLARACRRNGGRLLTVDWDPDLAARAAAHLKRAGLGDWAKIEVGDAIERMRGMAGSFDLIFIDIDKEQYRPALPHCHRLLKPGGLLVADNTGFQGAADFNRDLFHDDHWLSVNMLCFLPDHSPERDGLLLALRRPSEIEG